MQVREVLTDHCLLSAGGSRGPASHPRGEAWVFGGQSRGGCHAGLRSSSSPFAHAQVSVFKICTVEGKVGKEGCVTGAGYLVMELRQIPHLQAMSDVLGGNIQAPGRLEQHMT